MKSTQSVKSSEMQSRLFANRRELMREEAWRKQNQKPGHSVPVTSAFSLDRNGERIGDWWDTLPALDSNPYFPITSYLHNKVLPTCYRINLKPRFVYIAQKKAAEQGINFEAVLQAACYQAMKNLGVEFDSDAEMAALDWEIEKPQQDAMLHQLTLAHVYTDLEDLPFATQSTFDPLPPRSINLVEPPQVQSLKRQMEKTAKSLVYLRGLRKYDSIYADHKPTFKEAMAELELLLDLCPAYVKEMPLAYLSLKHQIELLRKYKDICQAELDVHLKLATEPMTPGMRAALLTRAKAEADRDRITALHAHCGRAKCFTEQPLVWAADLTSEERAALVFKVAGVERPEVGAALHPAEGTPALDLALSTVAATLSYASPDMEREAALEAEGGDVTYTVRHRNDKKKRRRLGEDYALTVRRHIKDYRKYATDRVRSLQSYTDGVLAIHFEWKYKSPAPYITRAKLHTDPYGASYVEES